MPVVPEGARTSTLNINGLHGGQPEDFEGLPAPVVADSCRMVIDRRFLIEESLEQVKGEVVSLLEGLARDRPGFTFGLKELFAVQPSMADQNGPVATAAAAAIHRVLGRPAPVRLFARHLRPEARGPDRQAEGLHRLRPGRSGSRSPAGRMGQRRRHGRISQGDGAFSGGAAHPRLVG